MKRTVLTLIALTFALMLTACEELGPKTVTITGLSSIPASGGIFTATTTGSFPIVGEVSVYWFIDADDDGWADQSERLKDRVLIAADADGRTVNNLRWIPQTSQVGKSTTLSVLTFFYDPGTDEATIGEADHTVAVKR